MAHYRGSTGLNYGKRQQPLTQQQRQPEHTEYSAIHQQPVQAVDSPYHEQSSATPSYDDFQQSLPPITSLLGNVSASGQQSESQQPPPQHRPLSRVQSSPNLRVQRHQSRSPLPRSNLRTQAYTAQTLHRRDSSSLTIPQQWREEDPFPSQQSYAMDTSFVQQQRPTQPQISPTRTQPPHISTGNPTLPQGYDYLANPFYPAQDPGIPTTQTQNPFYGQSNTTYLTPTTEMVPVQSPYPFNPAAAQIPSSGITYVGDSRAMLAGRAVSMGSLHGPQRIVTSPQEEDKRRRAASASARFRRRKKEQEEENLKEIQRLEKRIEELKKERDYWRDLAIRAGATGSS